MAMYDEAFERAAAERKRRDAYEHQLRHDLELLKVEQRNLLSEYAEAMRRLGVAPTRYEIKFHKPDSFGSFSYFPKRYIKGWKVSAYILTPDLQFLRGSHHRKNVSSDMALPFVDGSDIPDGERSGSWFKQMLVADLQDKMQQR
jgi:hypothetical protein